MCNHNTVIDKIVNYKPDIENYNDNKIVPQNT